MRVSHSLFRIGGIPKKITSLIILLILGLTSAYIILSLQVLKETSESEFKSQGLVLAHLSAISCHQGVVTNIKYGTPQSLSTPNIVWVCVYNTNGGIIRSYKKRR